ncbi:MAG: hypothetical protein AAGA60_00855 [Cyanobacteria bacterium P01_E01_bin.42]
MRLIILFFQRIPSSFPYLELTLINNPPQARNKEKAITCHTINPKANLKDCLRAIASAVTAR